MKNKRIITIVIGVILFAGVVGWYLYPSSPEHVAEIEQHIIEKEPVSQQVKKEEKKPIAQSIAEYIKMPNADAAVLERIKKIQKFQSLKTGKFDYYGKVIDQHGDPVVGATVKVDIGYYPFIPNGNFYPSHKKRKLVTDSEGKFSIVGEEGESVRIDPVPNGKYDFSYPELFALTFSRVGIEGLKKVGNPDKPVIFHAWKKTEAEPLYYGEIFQKIPQDGQFHSINIPALNGTMKVAFIIDPNGTPSKPLDWTVRLKVDGGGVIETEDIFLNEAPKDGYLLSWSKSHKKTDPQFSEWGGKKNFYIQGLNGSVYGRMEVEFVAYYNDVGVVDAKWWLNPNGSRNLQYDRSKRIQ